jgi:hypothetical protein
MVRPFRACGITVSHTQGVALGWHESGLWPCAETGWFDTLAAEAQRAIDLLQERRTALISAAVTGPIDVRRESYA